MDSTRKQDILLISLLGVAHGLSHYFHLIIPPLFPWIMPEFDASFAQMGAVMTIFFYYELTRTGNNRLSCR